MKSITETIRQQVKTTFHVDDHVVDIIKGEVDHIDKLSISARYTFLFHGLLAIVTNLLYPLVGIKRKVQLKDEDFVFISCPDPVFRTKNLEKIAGELKYSIVYLPNFHVNTAVKYHKFFQSSGINAYFPTIELRQIINALKTVKALIRGIKGMKDDEYGRKWISVLSNYAIYDQVVKAYMTRMEHFRGKWILEHQKFYFMSTVANLYVQGITSTMLQHGIFFKANYYYTPMICDKVLCCSEREKKIYIENGTTPENIIVLGAPIQTLQTGDHSNLTGQHHNVLVLLTRVTEQNVYIVRTIIGYIKDNYKNVLVRLRPRSRKKDKQLLSEVLEGMKISADGTPIGDDIMSSDKVVSFSVDANIEVVKYNKPFVYVWSGDDTESAKYLHCVTVDNYREEISKLMTLDFYSSFNKDQYSEILGETDLSILKNKFKEYIKSLN